MATLLQRHLNDYIPICNRMSLTLDGAESTLPTDRLVDRYTQTGFRLSEALMLEELYFHYGRYLLIASSRGEDTPANLQGIWNHTATPPWESDIHSNINVQMNYWPAEATNLSEMHMPYLNYVKSMAIDHAEWPAYAKIGAIPRLDMFHTKQYFRSFRLCGKLCDRKCMVHLASLATLPLYP